LHTHIFVYVCVCGLRYVLIPRESVHSVGGPHLFPKDRLVRNKRRNTAAAFARLLVWVLMEDFLFEQGMQEKVQA
jgi:hypothetical protein